VLLTGFDAFGEHAFNPTAYIVESIRDAALPGVACEVLPTSFARAERQLAEALSRYEPRTVLHLGLAATRGRISFEQVASNRDDSSAIDNDGEARRGQTITPGTPEKYASTLPWARLAELADALGEPVEYSNDAGGFVCNHVFYLSAHWGSTRGARVGFVHLPNVEAEGARCERFVRVVTAWVKDLNLDQG
jgi:pyroglutamyl-peptidase